MLFLDEPTAGLDPIAARDVHELITGLRQRGVTIFRTTAAACLFRSLADPTRLAIIGCLAEGEQRVVDLTRRLGLAQSTVSGHLACLRDCGLVDWRPAGRQSFYFLARPELPGLLTAAEQVLAATGPEVTLCPGYGLARAR